MKWISVMIISLLTNLITTEKRIFTVFRGGSRGDLRFSNTTGILQKILCGLLVLK